MTDQWRFTILMSSFFTVVIGGIVAAVWYAASVGAARYDRFMAQCMEDHKEYQCTAMWRAGDHPPPDVVVMPIPSGR